MKVREMIVPFAVLLLLSALSSCQMEAPSTVASLHIHTGIAARTVLPSLSIDHYSVVLTPESGAAVTYDSLTGDQTLGLSPGTWNLDATAFDTANLEVAKAQQSVTLVAGDNSVTVAFSAGKVATGTVSLDIAWVADPANGEALQITILPWPIVVPPPKSLARATSAYEYDVLPLYTTDPATGAFDPTSSWVVKHWEYSADFAHKQATVGVTLPSGTYEFWISTSPQTTSEIVQVADGLVSSKKIRDQGLMYGINQATEIAVAPEGSPQPVAASLPAKGASSYYKFTATQSDDYSISSGGSFMGDYPGVLVYDADGVVIAEHNRAGQNFGSFGIYNQHLEAGTYYLWINDQNIYGAGGNYTITVTQGTKPL
ncbi:MAG: hypothetical protein WCG80_15570 [Spirochaetales bacterium]